MNTKLSLLLALASTALAPAFGADISVDIRLGRALPPPPPEVVVVDRVGPQGPPPWVAASSHWYRRSYDYYFYPEANVYYRPSDHIWFYLDGRSWRTVRELPPGIRIDFGRAVTFKLDTDRPYTYHDRVVAYYPPTYFEHVRFKNDRDDRRDDHRDDRRDDRDRHDDRHP